MKCKSSDITSLKLPCCHPLNQPPSHSFYLLCFLFGVGTFVRRVIAQLNSIVIVFVVATLFQSVARFLSEGPLIMYGTKLLHSSYTLTYSFLNSV
jgi:hypothetical protein